MGKILIFILIIMSINVSASELKVMTYNTLNLFDTLHDQGKHDYTYLPLRVKNNSREVQNYCKKQNRGRRKSCLKLDWNKNVLAAKINELAKIIKIASPDIIVLEEVENKAVVTQLMNEGLKGEGYKTVILIEGQDSRGIDVGIISRFIPKQAPIYHEVDLTSIPNGSRSIHPTRGILEVKFNINGKTITVFGNHWPSQANNDQTRLKAGQVLYNAIDPADDLIIATGDFNTSSSDQYSGINEYLLNSNRKYTFVDSEVKHFQDNLNSKVHRGTYYFRGEWGTLDKVFVLNNSDSIIANYNKYNVIIKDYMVDANGPIRFNPKKQKGFSDHLPAVMSFEIK